MSKRNRKNEFRYSQKTQGHPAYIYKREGDKYKFIGITHAPITEGIKNIPLNKNPNPADSRKSYARPMADSDNYKKFSRKLKGWKISPSDKDKLKKIQK